MQFNVCYQQSAQNVWRKRCFQSLAGGGYRQLGTLGCPDSTREHIEEFRDLVDFTLNEVNTATFAAKLDRLIKEHSHLVKDDIVQFRVLTHSKSKCPSSNIIVMIPTRTRMQLICMGEIFHFSSSRH